MAESGLDETGLPRQSRRLVYIGCQRQYKKCTARRAHPAVISWIGSRLDRFLFYSFDTARGRLAGGAEADAVNMSDNHQAAIAAIQSGDVDHLKNLLRQDPSLATARPDGMRTLLHVATDWPGHFPN